MTIHIVDIEAVDTRYTKQWKEHLPAQLRRATNEDVKVNGGETNNGYFSFKLSQLTQPFKLDFNEPHELHLVTFL